MVTAQEMTLLWERLRELERRVKQLEEQHEPDTRPDTRENSSIKSMGAVHDFIVSLPDGYQTLVGERGMRLSGGERQRISLARAFLKDAPILILDEPTSAVDIATEAAIMEAMERLMCGRTTFMIAHRLSTLEKCDLQLQLENGCLVDVESKVNDKAC